MPAAQEALMDLNSYEKKALEEIEKYFRSPEDGLLGRVSRSLFKPVEVVSERLVPDKILEVAGKGVERLGRVQGSPSILDVTPSVAALLGLPPDPGWEGSALPGCPDLDLEPLDYLPLVPPESYRQGGEPAAPVDPEFLAKLKALGYLGGDDGGAESVPSRPPSAGGSGSTRPTAPTGQPSARCAPAWPGARPWSSSARRPPPATTVTRAPRRWTAPPATAGTAGSPPRPR